MYSHNLEISSIESGFVNAIKMNRIFAQYPSISNIDFNRIKPGSYLNVKNYCGESFWCTVINVSGHVVTASVAERLEITPDYNLRDTVSFHRKHIRAIYGVTKLDYVNGYLVLTA